MINIDQVKELREETGVSITECKKALEEAGGDKEKAKEILRKWGKSLANKRSDRETKEGIIDCYIHPTKRVGVLLEISCESDFVARADDFKNLSHEICLQIAAANPLFVKEEDIPEEFVSKEKQIYLEQIKESGKSQQISEQIVEGKLKKYKEGVSLLSQPWIKDNTKTVQDMIDGFVSKIGENIAVKKFVRYEI